MALKKTTSSAMVGNGSLRIERDYYPLRQIAHVGMREQRINRARAWRNAILTALVMIVLSALVNTVSDESGAYIGFIGVLVAIAWLVAKLTTPPVYGLVLGTSGADQAAVWSTLPQEIEGLMSGIIEALEEPTETVNVFHVTNQVTNGSVNSVYGNVIADIAKVGS